VYVAAALAITVVSLVLAPETSRLTLADEGRAEEPARRAPATS
jgi:hypothetical protein